MFSIKSINEKLIFADELTRNNQDENRQKYGRYGSIEFPPKGGTTSIRQSVQEVLSDVMRLCPPLC